MLSGIVLVLPALRSGRAFSWIAYYPRRIIRLYLPVIAAVALGAALVLLVTRFQAEGLGAWMNSREHSYTPAGLVRDVVLVFGPSGVISPLWSLRWEVMFSLLLPIFVAAAALARGWWWLKLVGAFALIAAGSLTGSPYLFFLPIFAVGAVLVSEWETLRTYGEHLQASVWAWPAILTAAVLLTTSTWILRGLGVVSADRFVSWIPVVGVTLFVLAAAFYGPVRRLLERPAVAWLGRVSFSLYLVHEPIIIAARFLTFPASPWVGVAIAVPIAFLVAWLFANYVEQPAHRLSKWAGMRVVALFHARGETGRGATTVAES